jgi:hypothetical protein
VARDGLGLPVERFGAQIATICRAQRAALATRDGPAGRQLLGHSRRMIIRAAWPPAGEN